MATVFKAHSSVVVQVEVIEDPSVVGVILVLSTPHHRLRCAPKRGGSLPFYIGDLAFYEPEVWMPSGTINCSSFRLIIFDGWVLGGEYDRY